MKFFPILLIILDLCAGIVYLIGKDYKQAIYWVLVAGITACVTF